MEESAKSGCDILTDGWLVHSNFCISVLLYFALRQTTRDWGELVLAPAFPITSCAYWDRRVSIPDRAERLVANGPPVRQ